MTDTASLWTSARSASMSTFIYSLLLTPFDVIKNTQISSFKHVSPYQTYKLLVKDTGVRTMWRGLLSASVTTFASNIIYYPCYELTKKQLKPYSETWSPGLAAILSRTLTVTLTLPVERLRTSIQSIGKGEIEFNLKGFRVTLQRDIIFSFTYFSLWENIYEVIKPFGFVMGKTFAIVVGSLTAALITHPFDVIKTKIQSRYEIYKLYDKNTVEAVRDIYGKDGIQGLYVGAQARVSKIVIGLMIYTNLYEHMKKSWEDKQE